MSFQIANQDQGELVIISGYATKVNQSSRKGKKEGEKVACVYVTITAMGAEPIDVRADMTQYNSDERNPIAAQFAALSENQPVMVIGRKRKFKDMVFFEPEKVHTDAKAFQYFGALTGSVSGK